jgi:hypothetical protein
MNTAIQEKFDNAYSDYAIQEIGCLGCFYWSAEQNRESKRWGQICGAPFEYMLTLPLRINNHPAKEGRKICYFDINSQQDAK